MKRRLSIVLLAAAGLLLSACATKDARNKIYKDKDGNEYVYYTPTGTNIPILVKKSDLAAATPSEQQTQDALRSAQGHGGTTHLHD